MPTMNIGMFAATAMFLVVLLKVAIQKTTFRNERASPSSPNFIRRNDDDTLASTTERWRRLQLVPVDGEPMQPTKSPVLSPVAPPPVHSPAQQPPVASPVQILQPVGGEPAPPPSPKAGDAVVTPPAVQATMLNMDRVAWCSNLLCTGTTANPDFPQWETAGVSAKKRRETYITVVKKPPRQDVEKIVMIAAGQQTDPPIYPLNLGVRQDGYPNVLTGQPDNYKNNCDKQTTGPCLRSLDRRSLAKHLLDTGKFPSSSTLFVLVHDTRLNYDTGIDMKQNIEDAFFRYFEDNSDFGNLKQIFFAGQSRGGCLGYRLGRRFRDMMNETFFVPTILQGFDAVCVKQDFAVYHKIGPELNVQDVKYYNPLNSNYYGWKIPLDTEFPNRTKLAMQQILGGEQVTGWAPYGVHAFAYCEYPCAARLQTKDTDNGWYRQFWEDIKHLEFGGDYSFANLTVARGLSHYLEKDALFG